MDYKKNKNPPSYTAINRYETTYSSSYKPIPKKSDEGRSMNEKIVNIKNFDVAPFEKQKSTDSHGPNIIHFNPSNHSYQHMVNQIARITDTLYLSGVTPINQEVIDKLGITLVVSMVVELPENVKALTTRVYHVVIEDIDSANIRQHFDNVVDRIQAEVKARGKVLVHCVAGISRSSTIVLAYFMKHHLKPLRDAYMMTLNRRPYIQPNLGFWRQLIDYERFLLGQNSVRMIPHKVNRSQLVPDVPPSALGIVLATMPSFNKT